MESCPVLFLIEKGEALMGFFKVQVWNRALGTQKEKHLWIHFLQLNPSHGGNNLCRGKDTFS